MRLIHKSDDALRADDARFHGFFLAVGLSLCSLFACDSKQKAVSEVDAAQMPEVDAAIPECTRHEDCIDQHEAHWICRSERCVSLLSDQCTWVKGDDTRDDAVILGLLAAEAGTAQVLGASDVARNDFATTSELPLEGTKRPLVLVGCTFPFGADPLPAARHLVDDIGVPAVIGPAASADVITVAQNVAIPAGTLLMSPFAQSDLLTDLADQDLVFRTATRTSSFAPLLAAMLTDVETLLRTERSLTNLKVALISSRDSYGIALSEATTELLRFNDKNTDENEQLGQFLAVSFDATEEGFAADVAERVIAFAPDVIISESSFNVGPFQAVEEAWPADGVAPPYYVMDGISGSADYAMFVASRPDSLRTRIRIVNNGDPKRPLYVRYVERVAQEFDGMPALVIGTSTYDATYALAFGIIAAGKVAPTGADIARGLRQLVGKGEKVDAFPDRIEHGVEVLLSGKPVDLDGVSGPLDFDIHGDVVADSSVSCFVRDGDTGKVRAAFAGQVYRVATGELEGTFECD